MARTEIHEIVLANTGSAMLPASGTVTVNYRDTETEAPVYLGSTGAAEALNPITISSTNGRIEGWLDPGSYDLNVETSSESYTQRYESVPGTAIGTAINPQAYGALGDGETDDRAAIQAAIAALPAGGGTIVLPNQTFACDFTTPLSLGNRNVTIQGEGTTSKLLSLNEGTTTEIKAFSLSFLDQLTLRNLAVQGPTALGAAGRFDAVFVDTGFCTVRVYNSTFSQFSRCFHINPTTNWIGSLDVRDSTLTGYASTGDKASQIAKVLTTGTGTRQKRVLFHHNSISGWGDTAGSSAHPGIEVPSDCDLEVVGNQFISSQGLGGCCVETGNDTTVIAANRSSHQILCHNHIAPAVAQTFVFARGLSRPRIFNNSFEQDVPCVYVDSGTPEATFHNNAVYGAAGFGSANIAVAGTLRVRNNLFAGSVASPIYAVGTAATLLEVTDNNFAHGAGVSVTLATEPGIYREHGNYGTARDTIPTVASNITIVPPTVATGGLVTVTGTTNIEGIVSRPAGQRLTLLFEDVLTVVDGGVLTLAGDFTTSADDTLDLVSDGSGWIEVGRSTN